MSEPNIHMSSDDWNKLKHLVDLSAENARLKAEVERLRHLEGVASSVDFYQKENEKLNEEIERLTMIKDACKRMIKRRDKWIFELKAEVERLRASSFVTAVPVEEYEKLKVEVERLTKSYSDALADFWAIHKGYFDLKAEVEQLRKEGKQP